MTLYVRTICDYDLVSKRKKKGHGNGSKRSPVTENPNKY